MTRRQRSKKRCDEYFSLYIRARDNNRCYTCGSRIGIQCGHLITRARSATRWDPINAKAQCETCNSLHEENPKPFLDKWIEQHGEDAYQKMLARAWRPFKYAIDDINELAKSFKAMYLRIKENDGSL